jgi:hypothetical protein
MVGTKPFLDEVPTYEIRDGTVYMVAGDWELAMPLRKFRLGMARAAKALAAYDAGGEVVPIRRKGRGQAARS